MPFHKYKIMADLLFISTLAITIIRIIPFEKIAWHVNDDIKFSVN